MLARLRDYLAAAYLLSTAPYADGRPGLGQGLWAALLLAAALYGLWRARRTEQGGDRRLWLIIVAVAATTLIALGWQIWGWGALSARIWALSGTVLLLVLLVTGLGRRRPAWLTPGAAGVLTIAMHGVGLALVIGQLQMGWLVAALVAVLALLSARGSGRHAPRWSVLAPLGLLYLSVAVRLVLVWLGVDLLPYRGAAFPNPLTALLSAEALAVLTLGWCGLRAGWAQTGRLRTVMLVLLALVPVAWYGATVVRQLSAGATGSDPLAYLQMAGDIVAQGTPQHTFPLAKIAERLSLPTWPTAPVGYREPLGGQAATVWPPGWSLLLALPLWLGGELLALWLAPFCHLGAAALTGWLGWALTDGRERRFRLGVAALAALLVLTSYEAVLRTLVPMADAAAALGGVGMSLLLLKGARRDRLWASLLAGSLLGLTYDIRHPQVVLGLAAVLYLLVPLPRRRRLAHLALYAGGALLLALPDLAYHAYAFGSPWITESSEWFLLAPANIPVTWRALWQDGWWRSNEWGYLWPFVLAGLASSLSRCRWRPAGWALLAGYGGCLLFHLSYQALRLRDLLPLFPWLALLAALGAGELLMAARKLDSAWVRGIVVAALLLCLAARVAGTLDLPQRDRVWTFGYVTAEERAGLESLARLTPGDAVIATGLNAGAVQRYAGRDILRPASWQSDEFERMLVELERAGRPLYVLDDGEEMAAWLAQESLRLEHVATVTIPRMGLGGQQEAGPGIFYRIVP